MEDDAAPTSPTWEAFAQSPATLFQSQHHPVRLLRQREQHGRLRTRTTPSTAHYTPGFTPFEMRHQLGFVSKAYDCRSMDSPLRHDGCVNAACWSEDGRFLYTAGDDRLVKTWDATQEFKRHDVFATGHEGHIFGIQVAPGRPDLLLTCSADGTLRRHDINFDLSFRGPERLVGYCAPHAVMHGFCFWDGGSGGGGGQVVLTAQGNGIVMKYDLREPSSAGEAIYHRRSPGGRQLSVKAVVTPDIHNTAKGISPFMMCLGGHGPTLEVHDLRRLPSATAKPLQTYRPQGLPQNLDQARLGMEEEVSMSGLALSKTRGEILVSYQGDQIYGFNTADAACGEGRTTHEAWSLGGHVNSQTFLKSVTYFGPREEYVACGDDLATTWIWDRRTGMLANMVCTDMSVANGCAPHPFLPMLACWGIDDMVKVLAVGGRYSSIKKEESVDKALEEEEDCGAAAGARQGSARERPQRGRGGREERGGGRRRAPRWTMKGLQLLPSQYFGTILEIGMVKRVFSNPDKPKMVYDHERYRQHVKRIRQFLCEPGDDHLPDYPTDSSDAYSLVELEGLLLEVKERGNIFFKTKHYRQAARCYKKIELWLFSTAEVRGKIDKVRAEASALGDSDQYERWLGDPAGSSLVPPVVQPTRRRVVVAKIGTETAGRGGGGAAAKNETSEDNQDAVLSRLVDLLVTSNLNLAMTVQAQGQHLHAIALCTSVIRIKPREAKAFYRRGVAALESGEDFEAALRDLIKARDLAPADALIARKLAEGRRLLKAHLARESRAYAAFFSSASDEEHGVAGGVGQG